MNKIPYRIPDSKIKDFFDYLIPKRNFRKYKGLNQGTMAHLSVTKVSLHQTKLFIVFDYSVTIINELSQQKQQMPIRKLAILL